MGGAAKGVPRMCQHASCTMAHMASVVIEPERPLGHSPPACDGFRTIWDSRPALVAVRRANHHAGVFNHVLDVHYEKNPTFARATVARPFMPISSRLESARSRSCKAQVGVIHRWIRDMKCAGAQTQTPAAPPPTHTLQVVLHPAELPSL